MQACIHTYVYIYINSYIKYIFFKYPPSSSTIFIILYSCFNTARFVMLPQRLLVVILVPHMYVWKKLIVVVVACRCFMVLSSSAKVRQTSAIWLSLWHEQKLTPHEKFILFICFMVC